MSTVLRKLLITFGTSLLVIFIYMLFDPSLRGFIYAIFLRLYLFVFGIAVKFIFKGSVISIATVAWKKILIVGGGALFKRFWINFAKKNAVEHVAKPLTPALKMLVVVHFDNFKKQPGWLQFSETTVGVIIISALGYLFGIINFLLSLIEKVLTGKFQSVFLTIMGTATKSLRFVWDRISPWFDVIFMTVFLKYIEKIPFVRKIFHKTKEVKDKVVEKKDQAIRAVVHNPVNNIVRSIENHTEKRLQKQRKECGLIAES